MKAFIKTLTIIIIAILLIPQFSNAQCHPDDWIALKALYDSTNGDDWRFRFGWEELIASQESPPANCDLGELHGIILNYNDNTRVQVILLDGNRLMGNIPPEIEKLNGLTRLNLSSGVISPNILIGSIPPEIGNLSNLSELILAGNELAGSIPPEIEKLSSLSELNLNGNNLSSISSEIGKLENLTQLFLGSNQFSSIPPEIGNLNNLEWLSIPSNQLSSIPPQIGNLNNLEWLDLQNNQIEGSIPKEIGNLEKLNTLRLRNNQLSGCYPASLTNLCDRFGNINISDGNNFDAHFEDFCESDTGRCPLEVDCSSLTAELQVSCQNDGENTLGMHVYVLNLTVSDGDENYTFSGDGSIIEEFSGLSFIDPTLITDGSIDITVEDGNGCTTDVSVPVSACPPVDCSNLDIILRAGCVGSPSGPGQFSYLVEPLVSGGDGNYTISGDVNELGVIYIDPTTFTDGSIDVVVEDGNGCTVDISRSVSDCPGDRIICPFSRDFGVFDCTNIESIPAPVTNLDEAQAPPYNIYIPDTVRQILVFTKDSDPIFYCEDNARIVTREVVFYEDVNLNCSYDPGEDLASCDFEISTDPDTSAPLFTAPSTTGTTCSLGWDPSVTGTVLVDENCPFCGENEVAYSDSLIPAELVIIRTWAAIDYCGNLFEQEQLIFIDDAENCTDELSSLVTNSPTAPCSIIEVDLEVSCEPFPCEETPDAYSFFGFAVELSISSCFGEYSVTGDLNQSFDSSFESIITEFIDPAIITDGSIDVVVEDRNGCIQEISVPVSTCPPVDCSTLTADLQATCILTPLISGEFIPEYEVILSISGGDGNYAISGDVNQEDESIILATTITDGSIDAIVEDGNGCIIEVSVLAQECPPGCSTLTADLQFISCIPWVTGAAGPPPCNCLYQVELLVSGGDGIYSVLGDIGEVGLTVADPIRVTDSSIDAIVADGNGCFLELSIPEPECEVDCSTLTADLQATCVLTPLISGEFIPEYEVILSISGGDGNYAISGDVDQAGESIILATTITDGSIDATIEDGNGCIVEVSEPVSDCPEIDCSTLSADLQIACSDDFTEYMAALAVNGGDGNYSISGDVSSIGTSSIDPATVTDGSIDVVVEDGNGCIVEANITTPECESPELECEGVQAVSTKTTNMDRYIKHLNRWSKYLPSNDTPIDSLNKN